jgi:hypothetical protein
MPKRSVDQELKQEESKCQLNLTGPFDLGFADLSGVTHNVCAVGSCTLGEVLSELREAFGVTALSLCLNVEYDANWTIAHIIQHHQFDVQSVTRVFVHDRPDLRRAFVKTEESTDLVEVVDHQKLFVPDRPSNAVRVLHNLDTGAWSLEDYLQDVEPSSHPTPYVESLIVTSTSLRCTHLFKVAFEANAEFVYHDGQPSLSIGLGNPDRVRLEDIADLNFEEWTEREVIDQETHEAFKAGNAFQSGVTEHDVDFANESVRIEVLCRFDEVHRTLTLRHLHRPSVLQIHTDTPHPSLLLGVNRIQINDNGESLTSTVYIEEVSPEEAAVFDLPIADQRRQFYQNRAAEVRECATRQVQIEVDKVLQNI